MLKIIRNQFLFLIPIFTVTFNPTKDIFGGNISLLDIFTFIQIILFVLYVALINKKLTPTKLSKYSFFLVVLLMFSCISLIVNEEYDFNLILIKSKYLFRWFEYLSIFTISYLYLRLDNLVFFKYGLYITFFISSLFALSQVVFFEEIYPLIYWKTGEKSYTLLSIRAFAFLDNPLNFCAYIGFPLGIFHFERNLLLKTLFIILSYIALILTASKIGIIVIVVSLILLFRNNKIAIISMITITTLTISYFSLQNNDFQENLLLIERLTNENNVNESSSQRVFVMNSSIKMILDNPILGIGNENFKKVYIGEKYIHSDASTEDWSFTAENFFLDFYLDNGLIPFIIIALFLVTCLALIKHTSNDIKSISISIIFYLIVAMVMSARTVSLLYSLFTFFGIQFKLNDLYKNEQ